jgi:hypothetical protein
METIFGIRNLSIPLRDPGFNQIFLEEEELLQHINFVVNSFPKVAKFFPARKSTIEKVKNFPEISMTKIMTKYSRITACEN